MERYYFYDIDTRGNLIHDNSIIDDVGYIDYFFKNLKPNDTGEYSEYPFISLCRREKNYVRAADTPIVFKRLNENRLEYGNSLSVEFSRENLRFSSDGVLYHVAPVGGIGRLSTQVVMELSKWIQPFGDYFSFQAQNDKYNWVIDPTISFTNRKILRPRAGNRCVGCGQDSPNGLHLSFLFDSEQGTAETWFVPDERLEGSLGIMHGGFVSLLLDEVMGKVLSGMAVKAPTANLNVQFRKPVPIGKRLHLHGKLISVHGRKHFVKGEIYNEGAQLLAEAEGLFIKIQIK